MSYSGLYHIFNVHGNEEYRWTISKNKILNQVPHVFLKEYRQDMSSMLAAGARYAYLGKNFGKQLQVYMERGESVISRWGNMDPMQNVAFPGKSEKKGYNPYEGLYQARETGNVYKFPWYSEYHHLVTSTWDDQSGAFQDVIATMGGKMNNYLSPAGGLDVPKVWQGNDPATYNYEFSLINTDFETEEEFNKGVNKHMNLIDTLILANLPIRDGFMTMYPPCIYSILIPGVRYCPACSINSLEISNVGQLNKYKNVLGEKRNDCIVPDEWKIRFMITELVKESNLIYQGAMDVDKQVKAISINAAGIAEDAVKAAMTLTQKAGDVAQATINAGQDITGKIVDKLQGKQ